MTSISANGPAESALRKILLNPIRVDSGVDVTSTMKIVQLTDEQKNEIARYKTDAASARAAEEKHWREIEQSNHYENKSISLPNISDLSQKTARTVRGIVEVMIKTQQDAGMTVASRFGDIEINSLESYRSYLDQYIGAQGRSGAASQAGANSARLNATA